MKKALVSVLFAALTISVSVLCYAAWRPVVPVAQGEPAVAAPVRAPAVFESGAVLVLAPAAREAPKARPVAARAKAWSCGERIVLEAGPKARAAEPVSARSCGWR